MLKKLKILTPLAIIIGALIISGTIFYFKKSESGVLLPQQAAKRAIDFINQNKEMFGIEGMEASLVSVGEENGVYKIKLKIGEREYDSYVTKNGKLFFTHGIDLTVKKTETTRVKEMEKKEKPEVKLFVMSFCPFGNQAEEMMKPVIDLLGEKIDFSIHYIISKASDGQFISLHGQQELNQDVREICVLKYQKEKFWDFVFSINKNCTSQNADACWEKVGEDLGINVQKIKECQNSEAKILLERELNLVKEYNANASPQLFINGIEYRGRRSAEDYKNAICSGFIQPPPECQEKLTSESTPVTGGCK